MSDKRCCPTDKGVPDVEYAPAGVTYYMVGPVDSKKGVLIVGDIFGIDIDNSKRYLDKLAAEGFLVVFPDFFGKKAWPVNNWPPDFESESWKVFHTYITDIDHHMKVANQTAKMMRQLGVQKICSVGMCWGTGVALRLAKEKTVDAILTAHPSFFTPESLEGYSGPIGVLFSKDEPHQEEIRAALKNHPSKAVCETYDKLDHGFLAARYEYEEGNEEQKKQLDAAEKSSFDFLHEVLK
ncbi:hypothetical protein AGDE_03714 [Angomonas deanei]|nr:hypothetical protein AGDE_03714 [Angomonas deanei]|eukprot:EPY40214.1 hypothetical protein AGDE_03714 [Angomonas deanei]